MNFSTPTVSLFPSQNVQMSRPRFAGRVDLHILNSQGVAVPSIRSRGKKRVITPAGEMNPAPSFVRKLASAKQLIPTGTPVLIVNLTVQGKPVVRLLTERDAVTSERLAETDRVQGESYLPADRTYQIKMPAITAPVGSWRGNLPSFDSFEVVKL